MLSMLSYSLFTQLPNNPYLSLSLFSSVIDTYDPRMIPSSATTNVKNYLFTFYIHIFIDKTDDVKINRLIYFTFFFKSIKIETLYQPWNCYKMIFDIKLLQHNKSMVSIILI